MSINIKQLTATIPYTTYNSMVMTFDLMNQDDVDALIQNLIEQALDKQLEKNQIEEYYDNWTTISTTRFTNSQSSIIQSNIYAYINLLFKKI